MKKRLLATVVTALCAILMFPLSACSATNGPDMEKIDPTRTQLYVYNYNGGYGSAWLSAAKKRFEEAYSAVSYEEGKTGVQIMINNDKRKATVIASQILDSKDEVYFTEGAYYYSLLNENHALGDITEAVTADLSSYGDASGRTVFDKLTDEQKAYYGVKGDDDKMHYYGVPHYAGYYNIAYNVDLFEAQGYYFKKDADLSGSLEDCFVMPRSTAETEARSAGPDGEEHTDDDGLPATYEEFYLLCDFIRSQNQTPLVWSGTVYDYYLTGLMGALAADFEGVGQMSLNYTLTGTATSLGTVQNGNFVPDGGNGTPITTGNGYEIARQEGKYRALQFVDKITEQIGDANKYAHPKAFNNVFSHTDAQEEFLYAGNDGGVTADIAMLVDGIWWQNEASSAFKDMVDSLGENYSSMNRNFAYMPLPKASRDKVNEAKESDKKTTLLDNMFSLCFMKANVAEWKKPLAMEFIKFVNSDASLIEFTQITNTPKAMQYTMNDEQKKSLTPYGRSLINMREKADIVYPYSNNPAYINNQAHFGNLFYTRINGSNYELAPQRLKENTSTAEAWFSGMKEYQQMQTLWRQ